MKPTRHSRYILIVLLFMPLMLQAANRALYDDEVLASAERRIARMDMQELEEFRNYLASCGTTTGAELRRYYCELNTRRYLLRYGRDGAVEALMQSLSVVGLMIDALDSSAQISQAQKDIMLKDIKRYGHVRGVIKAALRAAYQALDEKGHKSSDN